MSAVADEREVIRKLVLNRHLSVPERKAIPARVARASLIRSVIEEVLRPGSPLRGLVAPDDSMAGCVIEYRGAAAGQVEWRYSGIEGERAGAQEFGTVAQAAEALLAEARPFLGQAFDGVLLDWTA